MNRVENERKHNTEEERGRVWRKVGKESSDRSLGSDDLYKEREGKMIKGRKTEKDGREGVMSCQDQLKLRSAGLAFPLFTKPH